MAAASIGEFLDADDLSDDARSYLTELRGQLRERAGSQQAVQVDVEVLDQTDKVLAVRAEKLAGVYVYSFRHYLQHPNDLDSGQCWMKVGSTTQGAWKRILDQNRQTSMPEDPKLLRIYHSSSRTPAAVEDVFHRILDSAGHVRSSATHVKAGTEWFSTTLDLLDTLAEVLCVEIESLESD